MINRYIIETRRLIDSLTQIERNQTIRLDELKPFAGTKLRMFRYLDKNKYYLKTTTDHSTGARSSKYLGDDNNETVQKIKEARYLEKSLSVLHNNIKLLEPVVEKLRDIDEHTIEEMLPITYRGRLSASTGKINERADEWKSQAIAYKERFSLFHTEALRHKTDDGTMVRSKSEAIIYNLLLRLGVTFVYELPLRTGTKTFYPDFTILSEVDYNSTIIIEHQGMMNDSGYRDHFKNRVYDYLREGYVQGVNIFYTFDSLDGGIDTDPILDIVRLKIRPPELIATG